MTYAIIITGEIYSDTTQDEVVSNLAILFKQDASFIDKFFGGKPVIIKRGLDFESAQKYQAVIKKSGCVAKIMDEDKTALKNDAAGASSTNNSTGNITMAEVGTIILDHVKPSKPNIDISGLSMSEAGVQIIEPVVTASADIIIMDIDLLATGSTLSDETKASPANIDISGMGMSDVGVQLIEPAVIERADIDTTNLDLLATGSILSDEKSPVAPDIDTSKLSINVDDIPMTGADK